MSETIHKELAVKIVDKVKNIVTKGLYNIYELGVETYPYIYELCEAYGSGILMQITYDLYDSDILSREEYLQWKNNLNTKSVNFIKTNIEIIKEVKNVGCDSLETLYNNIKNYENLNFITQIKKNLVEKNIIKTSDRIKLGDSITDDLNKEILTIIELDIKNNYEREHKTLNDTSFEYPDTIEKVNILTEKTINEMNAAGSCLMNIGILTDKKDLIKTGSGLIGAVSIGTSIAAFLGYGSPAMLSLGPCGIMAGILSGSVMLFQSLQNNPENTQLQEIMLSQSKLLNQIRVEMHERFNQLVSILNEQQQLYLNKFCEINTNIMLLHDFLIFMDSKLSIITEKIVSIQENINEKFENLLNVITYNNIISERERIMRDITIFKMCEKDKFDLNIQNIISNILITNESLSGYSLINLSKDRFNLSYEFNINTAVKIVSNMKNITNYLSVNQIIDWITKNQNTSYKYNGYFMSLFLTPENIFLMNEGFIIINNITSWFLIECNNNIYSFVGSEKDYVKYIELQKIENIIFHKNTQGNIYEILNHIYQKNNNASSLSVHQEYKTLDIENLQNPILMSLYLNILMEKINEQRTKDNIFKDGFISIPSYEKLMTITHQILKHHDFVKICKNLLIYDEPVSIYKSKLVLLCNKIQHFYSKSYDVDFEEFLINLNKEFTNETTKLMNIFEHQIINIQNSYNGEWFYRMSHHVAGKFCRGETGCWNFNDGRQNNYINHMNSVLTSHKTTSLNNTRHYLNSLETVDKVVITENLINNSKSIPKYIPEYMEPLNDKTHPLLKTYKFESYISNDYFVSQFLNPKTHLIKIKYEIINDSFNVIFYQNTMEFLRFSLKYLPFHYVGNEAIIWFWYGGLINMDINDVSYEYDVATSCDNKWNLTTKYPNYSIRIPAYNINNQCYECQKFFSSSFNYFEEHNKLEKTKIKNILDDLIIKYNNNIKNDDECKEELDDIDFIYNKINLLLQCGNSKINKNWWNFEKILSYAINNDKDISIKILKKKIIINNSIFDNTPDVDIWLNFENTTSKFFILMDEIKKYVKTRITATEKLERNKEMSSVLIKVLSFVETNHALLKDFNVSEFMDNTTTDFNEKLDNGIELNFVEHLKLSMLNLPSSIKNNLMMIDL